jgi:predicted  nucleic acid-binding Zn-ribbon protein
MRRYGKLFVAGTCAMTLGFLGIALGQETKPEDVMNARISQLEEQVANIDNLLHLRTDTPGIQDRANRDYNVETRLTALERSLAQINNQLQDLQRQMSDAVRMASQAQSDAQMAQQLARDAASRIH